MANKYDIIPNKPKLITDIIHTCRWHKVGHQWWEVSYQGVVFGEIFQVKTNYWYGFLYEDLRLFRDMGLRTVELILVGSVINKGN